MRSSWKRKESQSRRLSKKSNIPDDRLLVVGLGNPGPRYVGTRHNVGFRVVEALVATADVALKRRGLSSRYAMARISPSNRNVFIAEPLTMMNRSGDVMASLLRLSGCTLQQLVIVCDSIDLPVGTVRLKRSGSAGGHNGLASIVSAVGSDNFPRLWIGVGRPECGNDVIGHVLGAPSTKDRQKIEAAERFVADHVLLLLEEPMDRVIHAINSYDPV